MKAHPRVAWQVVGERAVLVDLDHGRALALNETGSYLWSRLEGRTEAELVLELARAFDVTGDRAASDVRAFLGLLRERGFLEP